MKKLSLIGGSIYPSETSDTSQQSPQQSVQQSIQQSIQPSQQPSQELGVKIVDDLHIDTNAVLYGKVLPEHIKKIILNVITYYQHHTNPDRINGTGTNRDTIAKYLNKLLNGKSINYDKLMKEFNAGSTEELLAYMLLAYHDQNSDLMLRTMYTFGRILPFKGKTEWFDNYRLNAYGNAWNMIVYKQFDSPEDYSIDTPQPAEINKSVKLDFERVIKFLVGSLRAFIVAGQPTDYGTAINTESTVGGKSLEEICDLAYQRYPFFYGGCHGCDVFDIGYTLRIPEIKLFLERYPSAHVGYILNTSTYRSGKGEHWVALEFTKGEAKLICSQQGQFNDFHDGGRLNAEISAAGFGKEYNPKRIQTDDYNCGLYSAIALYELLRFNNIDDAVEDIGKNMSNFGKEIDKPSNADLIRAKIAGTVPNDWREGDWTH